MPIRAHAISTAHGDTTKLQVEAALATAVRHQNIVEVYGTVGEADDQWLVMEYVPARSLAQLIADEQALSVPRASHCVRQIADALDAVHRAEVVHGDVKPAKLLTTAQVSVVAGIDAGNPKPSFGDWECDWQGPNRSSSASRSTRASRRVPPTARRSPSAAGPPSSISTTAAARPTWCTGPTRSAAATRSPNW